MVAHAKSERPNECCGVLAGTIDAERNIACVQKQYALVNEAASPREYLSEPRSMFRAVKDMRGHGCEMLAIYHSHPASPAIPSRTDLERSYGPEVLNLIISLQGTSPEVRGWWLVDDRYEEAAWEIVEE